LVAAIKFLEGEVKLMGQEVKGAAAIKQIRRRLKKAYPRATTELNWRNPFELLIATILSAQTTDKKSQRGDAHTFQQVSGRCCPCEGELERG
jgi:endonuclease III